MTAAQGPPGASSTSPTSTRSSGTRVRLAAAMAITTLLVAAVVAVAAFGISSWRSDTASEPLVGTARVEDEVVVIIADEGIQAAKEARAETLRWSLVALGLSVVPAVAVGWIVAGRLLTTVETAHAEVEATEEERTRRLQEVVHELRTPLAVMGTNLELAASGSDIDPEAAGFIDAALRALDRMDRTVDDLAGQGRLSVDATHEAVDVASVARDVLDEYSGPARQRGLHLVAAASEPVVAESAEAAPLRTVIGNLVGNAVRLAPRGSVVTVDCGTSFDWAWIAVTDEGPGLPIPHHARVFDRGWQGPHERHRADGRGAGLGLTIARQLTEAQGGLVTIESEEGAGTTFTVWLPRTADADRADVVASDGLHPIAVPWRPAPVGS